ncbi:YncE family protein, partial [Streptomyces sp. NPDC127084]
MTGVVLVAGLALPLAVPQTAHAVPPGTYAYVANVDSDSVSVIDTASNTVTATIPVSDAPSGVGVS